MNKATTKTAGSAVPPKKTGKPTATAAPEPSPKKKKGTGNPEIDAFLSAATANWKKTQAQAKELSKTNDVDDGKYLCRVNSMQLGTTAAGKLQVSNMFTIVEGDEAGKQVRAWDGLEASEQSMGYFVRKIAQFGYDIDAIEPANIPEILAEITEKKPFVMIQLKTTGQFQNVYVNKVMDDDWEPEGTEDDEDTSEVFEEEEDESEGVDEDEEDSEAEDEDEEGDEDSEEGEAELEVGSPVEFEYKGKTLQGEVTEIDEDEDQVTIKTAKRTYTVPVDDVLLLVEDEE